MAQKIDFYFDFISPFSYLAYHQIRRIAQNYDASINWRVIDLAEAKRLAGNTGPTNREQPLKYRYNQMDKARWSKRYGVPIKNPTTYDSTLLNRGTFLADDCGRMADYLTYVWQLVWGEGGDMASETLLDDVARKMTWDRREFLDFVRSPAATQRYQSETRKAHERGIFGVPTMMVDEEMWWGNDRLEFLEEFLASRQATRRSASTGSKMQASSPKNFDASQ